MKSDDIIIKEEGIIGSTQGHHPAATPAATPAAKPAAKPAKFRGNKNTKGRLARGYFVEDFVSKLYDLLSGQLASRMPYVARPGQEPTSSQVSLKTYLEKWFRTYTSDITIQKNGPFDQLKNEIFDQIQSTWDKENALDQKLLAELGEQLYGFISAQDDTETEAEPPAAEEPAIAGEPKAIDYSQYDSPAKARADAKKEAETVKPATVTESSKRVAKLKKLLEK